MVMRYTLFDKPEKMKAGGKAKKKKAMSGPVKAHSPKGSDYSTGSGFSKKAMSMRGQMTRNVMSGNTGKAKTLHKMINIGRMMRQK